MRFYIALGVLILVGVVLAFVLAPGRNGSTSEHCLANSQGERYCCYPQEKAASCRLKVKFRTKSGKWQTLSQKVPHNSFRLDTGDLNLDGYTDFFLGLSLPGDSTPQKQIGIYLVGPEAIRKTWQATTKRRLYDFQVLENPAGEAVVRTISHDAGGRFCIGEYRWMAGELRFLRYLHRHLTLSDAQELWLEQEGSSS